METDASESGSALGLDYRLALAIEQFIREKIYSIHNILLYPDLEEMKQSMFFFFQTLSALYMRSPKGSIRKEVFEF